MYRILVVDSEMATQDFFSDVLDASRFRLRVTRSGAEALNALHQAAFDVVITETQLSDMPGWVLVPYIRRLAPHAPVIAISADDSWHHTRRMRIEAGPIFFFGVKPLNRSEMQHAVQAAAAWSLRRVEYAGSIGVVADSGSRR